jgi:hypothetical protein
MMDESNFVLQGRSQDRKVRGEGEERIHFSWSAEEQLLQSISTPAPLPKMLNEICIALDCHIGNVVSFISLPWDDPGELAAIALNAERFGLYSFYSEDVVAEDGEPLGSLEMYCSPRRSPSAGDLQSIERAKRLAAIAIKCHKETKQAAECGRSPNRPARGRLLEWPVPLN